MKQTIQCCICNKEYEGYLTDYKQLSTSGNLKAFSTSTAYRCKNCGSFICEADKKPLKFSFWSGFEKSVCLKCGQPFGPDMVMITVPIEAEDIANENETKAAAQAESDASAYASRVFKYTYLCDPLSGEKVIDEIQTEKADEKALVLTDRRLIYKTKEVPVTFAQMFVNETMYTYSWSFDQILKAEVNEKLTNAELSITIDYGIQSLRYVWNLPKSRELTAFAERIRNAAQTGTFQLSLPEGEEFLFRPKLYLQEFHQYPFGEFKNVKNNHWTYFAMTNRRLLMYEIDQRTGGKETDKFGPPHLVYCSIPFSMIKKVKLKKLMFNVIEPVFDTPLTVWRVPGLTFPADADLTYSPESKTVRASDQLRSAIPNIADLQKVDPFGEKNKEWSRVFFQNDYELKYWTEMEPIFTEHSIAIEGKK